MVSPKNNIKSGFRGGRDSAAIQENIELLTGQRGNGLDRAITMRELASLGLINVTRNSNGAVTPRPKPPVIPDGKPIQRPHSPVGFAALGGFGAIMLEWENPTFYGFSFAELWRAAPNADGSAPYLEQAVLIATTPATVFGDIVNPGSTYYYWCRFVNINNIAGPYNNVDGVKVSTSPNISDIIDDIGEQMKKSYLIQELEKDISEGDKAANTAIELAKKELVDADNLINASIGRLKTTVSNSDSALAKRIDGLAAQWKSDDKKILTVAKGDITRVQKILTNKDNALASDILKIEAAYKKGDNALTGAITALNNVTAERDRVVSKKVDTVRSSLNNVTATVQQNSQSISSLNQNGSIAHKAMWNTKAKAGDIKAGIGLLAKSDGTSQVAISASQFFVFDPNISNKKIQPLFAIDKGKVIIPKAFIEKATIQILNAQTIVADRVKAGISINSPVINGGQVTGGWAGFGSGGPYAGYHTNISSNGTLQTDRLYANKGELRNIKIHKDCQILGKLTVNQIEGDIFKRYIVNKAYNGKFSATPSTSKSFKRVLSITIEPADIIRTLVIPTVTCYVWRVHRVCYARCNGQSYPVDIRHEGNTKHVYIDALVPIPASSRKQTVVVEIACWTSGSTSRAEWSISQQKLHVELFKSQTISA
ncbi:hypothetical protein C0W54_03790 [Photobacterium kishitanii]|uniref:phage tail tip fiber protein n=1 Tax=Photobacterium kishitanii TaxID=318456 RepID=UPI000D16716C|nr:DUF1983 domain-containing protein [Photobacterium kishitanii]PSW63737.1 hypothetical protein C0W54_03790 [Photobacterium kishitanii]